MSNKEKWIESFRRNLVENGIDESRINDEDILQLMKSCMAPGICKQMDIEYQWQYELFWNSLINFMEPQEGMIGNVDAQMFRDNLNEN